MIPELAIAEWRREAPWTADWMVEQDLVISRALVELYSVPELAERLAFRGGTALYKLYLHPAARYSEDIDLVQIHPTPIGETLDHLRSTLAPWLGEPQRKFSDGRVTLVYRFGSSDTPPVSLRLKLEINTREHFTELGLVRAPLEVDSQWFRGRADVTTFNVNELLGTKLRALYQRKKGRDLFDLWYALVHGGADADVLVACFERYMAEGRQPVTRAQFEANLHTKAGRKDFRGDMAVLLRHGVHWDFDDAMGVVLDQLIARLPGDPWRGAKP